MDDAETPTTRPSTPKPGTASTPTEAELSRMAREAVRQPADPRLDRQLERMGLTESAAPEPSGTAATDRTTSEIERLQEQVRRLRLVVIALVVVIVVLVAISASQLLR